LGSRIADASVTVAACAAVLGGGMARAEDVAPIGYASVAAVRAALQSDATATFSEQRGWTVAASREHGQAVEWFFTPEGHPAHPAVIKRTVVEREGVGTIDMTALCQTPQEACDRLLEDFKQTHKPELKTVRAERIALDVGIAENDHDRVRVNRLVAEEGKAAEIRVDGGWKAVFVPTLDATGGVTLWTAIYEFDGRDFALIAQPQLVSAGLGTAEIKMAASSGNRFAFSITRLPPPPAEE
jgi:hypothetical protein